MRASTLFVIATLGVLRVHAEIISARSPCLPATLAPTEETDTDATLDRGRMPPLSADIYKEVELRGSIYGEIAVGNVAVNPPDNRARPPRDNRAQAAQDNACP